MVSSAASRAHNDTTSAISTMTATNISTLNPSSISHAGVKRGVAAGVPLALVAARWTD